MHNIKKYLRNLKKDNDEIFSSSRIIGNQINEINERSNALKKINKKNYLKLISKHHSIPVNDKNILDFLEFIPQSGFILDVGGAWGYHWRNLYKIRPDITLFIIDIVRENLKISKEILSHQINKNIYLIHGDGQSLPFEDNTFNGYWNVQTLQHVPKIEQAICEAKRVLIVNGVFFHYQFNYNHISHKLFKIFGRKYKLNQKFHGNNIIIHRSNLEIERMVSKIFNKEIKVSFSELIFFRVLFFSLFGGEKSVIGKFDSTLSGSNLLNCLFSRQMFIFCCKN